MCVCVCVCMCVREFVCVSVCVCVGEIWVDMYMGRCRWVDGLKPSEDIILKEQTKLQLVWVCAWVDENLQQN